MIIIDLSAVLGPFPWKKSRFSLQCDYYYYIHHAKRHQWQDVDFTRACDKWIVFRSDSKILVVERNTCAKHGFLFIRMALKQYLTLPGFPL